MSAKSPKNLTANALVSMDAAIGALTECISFANVDGMFVTAAESYRLRLWLQAVRADTLDMWTRLSEQEEEDDEQE